ncbi:MAG: PilZ domain-containing protein [Candidatus Aureabacteria bacterium]|nr:PilZ domain-containing protein [Candidatus Auribacterota bacterium]
MIEKRKTARIYKKIKIEVKKDAKIRNLGSIDLSSMGIRFRTNKKVPLFDQLDFSMDLSTDEKKKNELSFRATVIRCEKCKNAKGYQVTLFFHDLKKSEIKKIEQYIEKLRIKK